MNEEQPATGDRKPMSDVLLLPNVKAIKSCAAGQRVALRAKVLRLWQIGGVRMALVGDESALTRVELGGTEVEPGRSYELRDAIVRVYPASRGRAPWHSLSLEEGGSAVRLAEEVTVSQSEEYIEFTYKILSGVQRKKARKAGRVPEWRRPGSRR